MNSQVKKGTIEIYYETLMDIRKNFKTYFETPSLNLLRSFLYGYGLCIERTIFPMGYILREAPDYHIELGMHEPPEFREFIINKFKNEINERTLGTRSYFSLIQLCCSSEEEAFYKYFDLLKEYLETSVERLDKEKTAINSDAVTQVYESQNLSIDERYYEMLNLLGLRGGMYLAQLSIRHLEVFLTGYHTCIKNHQLHFEPHAGFNEFVCEKYHLKMKKSAYDVIEFLHFSNDLEKFCYFFKLLDEFLKANDLERYRELLNYDMIARRGNKENTILNLVNELNSNRPMEVQTYAIKKLKNTINDLSCYLILSGDENTWPNAIQVMKEIGYPRNKYALYSLISIFTRANCPDIDKVLSVLKEAEKNVLIQSIEIAIHEGSIHYNDGIWKDRIKSLLEVTQITKSDFTDQDLYDLLENS